MKELLKLLYKEYYAACGNEQYEKALALLMRIMDIEFGEL